MEAVGTSETLVYFNETTRHNIPERCHLQIFSSYPTPSLQSSVLLLGLPNTPLYAPLTAKMGYNTRPKEVILFDLTTLVKGTVNEAPNSVTESIVVTFSHLETFSSSKECIK
jgi:hypothetical protein